MNFDKIIALIKIEGDQMSPTLTISVSQQTLEAMYKHYATQIVNVPAHTMFQAKTSHCTITAYLSKKVVFQGKAPELEANKWGTPQTKPTTTKKVATSKLPSHIATLSAVGADEVGTGDYLGPIVVCCAYVRQDQIETLLHLGIKDSKQLNDSNITHLAAKLKKEIPFHCIILPNDKYNLMVDKGMNANSIKAFLHNKAMLALEEKLGTMPEYVILDEFVNERKYYDYLKTLPSKPNIYTKNLFFVQKGEGVHVAVAAASIIARAAFVEYMDMMAAKLGMPLPKGAGPGVDRAAADIYRLKGETTLQSISKWHFANSNKVKRHL